MNQAKADASDDLFTTETAGLPEVQGAEVTRLADGDRLDLRIGPARKNIDGAELRMLAYNGSVPGPVLHVDQGSQHPVGLHAVVPRHCERLAMGDQTVTYPPWASLCGAASSSNQIPPSAR